jgi:glutathione S-transferase
VTQGAPADYKSLHLLGAARVIEDGVLVLAKAGAIIEYIIEKYNNGRLSLRSEDSDFSACLY